MHGKVRNLTWGLFALTLSLAILLRFYHLQNVPPALLSDAAINGADGWRLINRGGHTPFLSGNGGRESLFIYLQGFTSLLLGTTPLAARLPSVLADVLTVGLGFWFSYWLSQQQKEPPHKHAQYQSQRLALFTGLAMAVSPWLIAISRLGFRGALVPPLTIGFFWAFLAGWHNNKWRWFTLAGLLLGLTGYTYTAAKVLPIILISTLLLELLLPLIQPKLFNKKNNHNLISFKSRFVGLGIMLFSATLTYLPMLNYIWHYPGQTTDRSFSVALWAYVDSTTPALLSALLNNVWLTLGYFCCKGNSALILFGPSTQTALNPALGIVLLLGFLISLTQFNRITHRLIALWFLLALLPGLLAIEAPHPLRLIAAAPPTFILLAWGLDFLVKRLATNHNHTWLVIGCSLGLVISGLFTLKSYFVQWPSNPKTQEVFQVEAYKQTTHLIKQIEQGQIIYIPRNLYAHAPIHYYLLSAFPPQAQIMPPTSTLPVTFLGPPWEKNWVRLDKQGANILPPLDHSVSLSSFKNKDNKNKDNNKNDDKKDNKNNNKITTTEDKLKWQQITQALNYNIGPVMLQGANFSSTLNNKQTFEATLFWQAQSRPTVDYQILVQLVDDEGQVWHTNHSIQATGNAYPPSYWQPNRDIIADYRQLYLKENLPVGRYWLAVALIDPRNGQRLTISPTTRNSPDTLFLGPLKVAPPPVNTTHFSPTNITFNNVATLRGYQLNPSQLTPGQPLSINLWWQSLQPIPLDYTVFVHIVDTNNTVVAGHDGQPVNNTYPTTLWSIEENIVDSHLIDTTSLASGTYQITIGLYNFNTGERVSIEGNNTGEALLPTTLIVTP